MDERYIISYLDDETPSAQAVIDRCLELGLSTTENGRTDVCSRYEVDGDRASETADRQTVVDGLSAAERGSITFWYGQLGSTTLKVSIEKDGTPDWEDHKMSVSIRTMPLDPTVDLDPGDYTRERVQKRVETIVQVVGSLAELTEPEYVYGTLLVGPNPFDGIKPTGRPISEHIDTLPWISVLSEPIIEDFGGRERVLNTPAWHVEELETGHIVIVRTDNPIDSTEGPSVSIDEYLLEGASLDELERDQTAIADPFSELEPGDLGTDLIVPRENVEGDLANDDLEVVRCEVREQSLWDYETDEFSRRIIDADGTLRGELPDGIDPEDEPYPALIRLDVPPEFVRLDEPTDETVVTKVMDLDVEGSKLGILDSLASAVPDENDPEAIAAVEDLVDQLGRLEDVDGIERFIANKLP